jgi:hypothetical protein
MRQSCSHHENSTFVHDVYIVCGDRQFGTLDHNPMNINYGSDVAS